MSEEEFIDAEVPAPVVIWDGIAVQPEGRYRVVATFHPRGNAENPDDAWRLTVEVRNFDSLAVPSWNVVERRSPWSTEINPEYALALEAALTAIGERMAKVREKVGKE